MTIHDVQPGHTVECRDDRDSCHFLRRGNRYVVESTQTDSAGGLRLNLAGMARAWEAERFRPVLQSCRSSVADATMTTDVPPPGNRFLPADAMMTADMPAGDSCSRFPPA